MRIEASPVTVAGLRGVSPPASSTGTVAVSSLPPATALRAPTILMFDSGLGGLSVFRELARARPDARFIYAADDAAFPYGALSEDALVARVMAVMDRLIARTAPDAVVVSCNTASTLVLPPLRARFAIPFVGTVPAIKPACESSLTREVSVLATPGTVRRDYTQKLIQDFAGDCHVTLVGSTRLAPLAEAAMRGEEVSNAEIAAEIAPAFVREGRSRTDTVVLACTHYPLLLDRLKQVAPWPVRWIDPAAAIARRLSSLVGPVAFASNPAPMRLFSTGRPLDAALVERIGGRRSRSGEILDMEASAPA